jgi:hypothetical protein
MNSCGFNNSEKDVLHSVHIFPDVFFVISGTTLAFMYIYLLQIQICYCKTYPTTPNTA